MTPRRHPDSLRARLRAFVRRVLGIESSPVGIRSHLRQRLGIDALGAAIAKPIKQFLDVRDLEARQAFVMYEIQRLGETLRRISYAPYSASDADVSQTMQSFDYQWRCMNEGDALPSDPAFMSTVQNYVCEITRLPAGWFPGKKVLDLGCGSGRFSLALLSLGSRVTSVDQSEGGIQQTRALCGAYSDRHETARADILNWDASAEFDLVFCFGVVHHTGNTYLAIRNAARKVSRGGRLFLMAYGYPAQLEEFKDLERYEALRSQLRTLSFEAKKRFLADRFGRDEVHGYFDAASPRINDLLSFGELYDFLTNLGFVRIERTAEQRNHFVIADKP